MDRITLIYTTRKTTRNGAWAEGCTGRTSVNTVTNTGDATERMAATAATRRSLNYLTGKLAVTDGKGARWPGPAGNSFRCRSRWRGGGGYPGLQSANRRGN